MSKPKVTPRPSIEEVFKLQEVDDIETQLHVAVGAENVGFLVSREDNPTDVTDGVVGRGDLHDQAVNDVVSDERTGVDDLYLYAVIRLRRVSFKPQYTPL